MLLPSLLKSLVKVGTLHFTDARGHTTTYSGSPGPEIGMHTKTRSIEQRLCWNPELALGEGYMSGEFVVTQGNMYDFLNFVVNNLQAGEFSPLQRIPAAVRRLLRSMHRNISIKKARNNVAHHYDLSGDLYNLFLDTDKQYSCAYFETANDDLETAQANKKCHIAAKLGLAPKQKILDIGCGWGGLALYLAQTEDVEVTGLTISEEQFKIANQRAKAAGLSDRVKFLLRDYREEQGQYDRIVSVGMFEHVGRNNYPQYFDQIKNLLSEDGIALVHSIGQSTEPSNGHPWIQKYIFPDGYCPALSETLATVEKSGLVVADIEIMHRHYAETLRHWRNRFMANRDQAASLYDEQFCRMWEFYLASCEVSFRNRCMMVFQLQLTRNNSAVPLTRDYITDWERKHKRTLKNVV